MVSLESCPSGKSADSRENGRRGLKRKTGEIFCGEKDLLKESFVERPKLWGRKNQVLDGGFWGGNHPHNGNGRTRPWTVSLKMREIVRQKRAVREKL